MAKSIETTNYTIHINEPNILEKYIQEIQPSKVFILVDDITEQLCLHRILEVIPENSIIIHVDNGEKMKNIDTVSFIWKSLLKNGADRHSLFINLGGGVIGDMGGFCASTFMRGMKFIQIPTTLLSQVDSSVGSKLGIDFENVKNIIGVFQDPYAVLVNTKFLQTLPYKQLLSGYAEVLKHALIADRAMWENMHVIEDITTIDFETFVAQNIAIKNNIVSQDPKEIGIRKILNFGHTIGHAVESLLLNTEHALLHGEAIAIGMVCESYLSYLKGYITLDDCMSIKSIFLKLYGHKYKTVPELAQIIEIMKYDKKNKAGKIKFSLLEKIGKGNFDQEVSEADIDAALEWYKK
jgi:3-dehydroquinate synthase